MSTKRAFERLLSIVGCAVGSIWFISLCHCHIVDEIPVDSPLEQCNYILSQFCTTLSIDELFYLFIFFPSIFIFWSVCAIALLEIMDIYIKFFIYKNPLKNSFNTARMNFLLLILVKTKYSSNFCVRFFCLLFISAVIFGWVVLVLASFTIRHRNTLSWA